MFLLTQCTKSSYVLNEFNVLTRAGKRGGVRHGHEYQGAGDLRDGPRCTQPLQIDQRGAVTGGRAAGANTTL